jgi:hypothetical protein
MLVEHIQDERRPIFRPKMRRRENARAWTVGGLRQSAPAAWISIFSSGLICLALHGFASAARAEEFAKHLSVYGTSFSAEIAEPDRNHQIDDHAEFFALADFVRTIDAEQPRLVSLDEARNPHHQFGDADLAALPEHARQTAAREPELVSSEDGRSHHPQFEDADIAALRQYARQIGVDQSNSAVAPQLRMAEADTVLDALREYLRKGA